MNNLSFRFVSFASFFWLLISSRSFLFSFVLLILFDWPSPTNQPFKHYIPHQPPTQCFISFFRDVFSCDSPEEMFICDFCFAVFATMFETHWNRICLKAKDLLNAQSTAGREADVCILADIHNGHAMHKISDELTGLTD